MLADCEAGVLTLFSDVDTTIVSDLFGTRPSTAYRWPEVA